MDHFYAIEVILFIFIASSSNIVAAQRKFGNSAQIEKSDVNRGPAPISSRFLDLGGVISQLFSGFNQGSGAGGGPGLNLPPNSQFYPGVPAQAGYSQPPNGPGNDRTFFNQGNIQGNNFAGQTNQNQQQWNRQPNQNRNSNNYLRPAQNQNWQNNNQNFNQNRPQGSYNDGSQFKGLTTPWYTSEGNVVNKQPTSLNNNRNYNQNRPQGSYNDGSHFIGPTTVPWHNSEGNVVNEQRTTSSWNEGTLDDFFTTQRTAIGNTRDDRQSAPDRNDFGRNAILGKPVVVPSLTSSDNIVFIDDSRETPAQKQCVQNCPTISEYDPVCGTDGVTYFNAERLICARNCGIKVFEARQGNCMARG